jgi:hypothetical protein
MAENKREQQLRLVVSAVLAHLRIPAGLLAEMGPADRIEIEAGNTAGPIVSFEVQGHTVARGYGSEKDGRFSAKVFWTGCQPSDRASDPWTLRR